jgi:1-acyl-sn-glycerol-3-phosphate acyltransferase
MGMRKYFRLIGLLFIPLAYAFFFIVLPNVIFRKILPLKHRYKTLRDIVRIIYLGLRIDLMITNPTVPLTVKDHFIVCNHHSFIDPFLIIHLFKHPVRFLAKKEVLRLPLFGKATLSIDALFINRKDTRSQIRSLHIMRDALSRRTTNWLVFPEGTRNQEFYSQPMLPFKPGAFKQAMEAKVNILPMVTYGFQRVLDKRLRWKKFPVQIEFLEPITPDMYEGKSTREVTEMVQHRMQVASDALVVKDRAYRLERRLPS